MAPNNTPDGSRRSSARTAPTGTGTGTAGCGGGGVSETGHVEQAAAGSPATMAPDRDKADTATPRAAGRQGRGLRRGLARRHVSMLGIAGAVGTGLFLGLGSAVARAGPLGSLLAYATVGAVVCAVQLALGEVTGLLPVTGSFVRHAEALVDPAWGFAVGWNLVYGSVLSVPSEMTAVCALAQTWTATWTARARDATTAGVLLGLVALTAAVGLSGVGVAGEVEFWFGALKVLLVVFLVVLGLVIDLGGVPGVRPLYFSRWADPGPFVAGTPWPRFLGYWAVMTGAVFSFAGVEAVAMAAAETRDPRAAIPAACRNVFLRITLFYVLAILVVGMLVRSDDPRLRGDAAAAAQSPFVVAASAAGLPAVPSVVNALVAASAWSAANQSLLSATRVLYALAAGRQAPRVFLRTNTRGVPHLCVLACLAPSLLSFMALSSGAMVVFLWMVNLTAAGVLVSWIAVLLNHVRLRGGMARQGIAVESLPWGKPWTVYFSYFALVMCVLILLTSGLTVFTRGNWSASTFVSAYLDIPLVTTAYLAWKSAKKTRIVALDDIPLASAFERADREENDEPAGP